ncbi:hypothetical protein SAMN05444972_10566 [Marininema halotolerans]|uniref:Uncharacterized protein n=1 Tax=Marininema halotolerans TaxID=1155944 RepID=A0A1I6RG50_9BACL|nr:hypothetical protein SAMN05444972_10566 [Marininema halotolerans]
MESEEGESYRTHVNRLEQRDFSIEPLSNPIEKTVQHNSLKNKFLTVSINLV